MRVSLLSNVNIDSLMKKLENHEVYTPSGYGAWFQELIDFHSGLYDFQPQAVFILLDAEQLFLNMDLDSAMSETERYFSTFSRVFSQQGNITFFVSDIDYYLRKIRAGDEIREGRFVEIEWYKRLTELTKKLSNVHIFGLKELVEREGRKQFYSYKLWYLGGMKYSMKAENVIKNEIEKCIRALEGKRKKCVALDLDNTLWGGVVGEEGIEGIELSEFKEGARYRDFQKRLKELKEMGVILTIVSKNNEPDALEVFEKHKNMVLKKEDFALMKINWEPKPKNLREIAEELNIGIDSIVFIDDNPVERELMQKNIPEVVVPEFPKDTAKLVDFVEEIYGKYFYAINYTEEDKKKTQMYIQNAKRAELRKKTVSVEEFLKELGTRIYVWKLKEEDVPRATQLTQKTNQFNLTTKRYTENDIRKFMKDKKCDVYIASVEDKFGDNGKVVLMVIKKDEENKTAEVDTFLMSCRVMGRHIEDQFVDYVENKLREEGIKKVKAYYFPTKKNKPVENLFERLGYELIKKDGVGNKVYELNLDKQVPRKCFGELIEK